MKNLTRKFDDKYYNKTTIPTLSKEEYYNLTSNERLSIIYTFIDKSGEGFAYQYFRIGILLRYSPEKVERTDVGWATTELKSTLPPFENVMNYLRNINDEQETIFVEPHVHPKKYYLNLIDEIYTRCTNKSYK